MNGYISITVIGSLFQLRWLKETNLEQKIALTNKC